MLQAVTEIWKTCLRVATLVYIVQKPPESAFSALSDTENW